MNASLHRIAERKSVDLIPTRRLILASASPRRREMLARLGARFTVEPAAVDERRRAGESPPALAMRLALQKAHAAHERIRARDDAHDYERDDRRDDEHDDGRDERDDDEDGRADDEHDRGGLATPAILAGDTVVALGDAVFGKPADRDDAVAMLRRLSGATHTVFCAVALLADGRELQRMSVTEVAFRRLGAREIERYCDTAEPFDKAGAYAIQGAGGAFVQSLRGSYSGVVGLPMWETWRLLQQLNRRGESRGNRNGETRDNRDGESRTDSRGDSHNDSRDNLRGESNTDRTPT
ncbi:MAG: Maf family protein [bacterium]